MRLPILSRSFLSALLLLAAGLSAAGAARADDPAGVVLAALNHARTDPADFATVLQQHRAGMDGKRYLKPGTKAWITTQEGTAAVDEAIAVLRATAPLPALAVDARLAKAAQDHVAWQGPRGETGHDGEGGGSPGDRIARHGPKPRSWGENISYGAEGLQVVINLIVDDGVASRGHRKNILNPAFRLVGIAVGGHQRYGTMCVMDLAAN